MKKALIFAFFAALSIPSQAQKLNNAEEVINRYLEVTKMKGNTEKIMDMTMAYTSESPRGVAENEFKFLYPLKVNMTVFANGMELMSVKYDGNKLERKSNWGGNNQPAKTGYDALSEASRMNPFVETNFAALKITTTLNGTETIDGKELYVVEMKDSTDKKWKDFYDVNTGLKTKSTFMNETSRGKVEGSASYENYKPFKGSEILFPTVIKRTSPMGEIASELQSIKFNKGLKDKDFEIK